MLECSSSPQICGDLKYLLHRSCTSVMYMATSVVCFSMRMVILSKDLPVNMFVTASLRRPTYQSSKVHPPQSWVECFFDPQHPASDNQPCGARRLCRIPCQVPPPTPPRPRFPPLHWCQVYMNSLPARCRVSLQLENSASSSLFWRPMLQRCDAGIKVCAGVGL